LKVKQLLFEPDRRDENVIKEGSPQHFRICFSLRKISSYNIIDSAKEDKEKAKREKERMREEKRIKKLSLIQEVTADEGEDGHITYRSDDIEIRNASKRDTGSSRSSVDEDRKSSPKSKHSSRSSSRRSRYAYYIIIYRIIWFIRSRRNTNHSYLSRFCFKFNPQISYPLSYQFINIILIIKLL
jgi:hypothetical protein